MGRTLPILAIVGAALGALTATILVEPAPAVVGLYAIGAGIALAMSKDWRRLAPGIAAIVFGLVGILGTLQYIGGEGTGWEMPISAAAGQALIVIAGVSLTAAAVLLTWRQYEPDWMSYVWAGLLGAAIIGAAVYSGQLGDQTQTGSFVVAVLALSTIGAPIMQLRHTE